MRIHDLRLELPESMVIIITIVNTNDFYRRHSPPVVYAKPLGHIAYDGRERGTLPSAARCRRAVNSSGLQSVTLNFVKRWDGNRLTARDVAALIRWCVLVLPSTESSTPALTISILTPYLYCVTRINQTYSPRKQPSSSCQTSSSPPSALASPCTRLHA